MSRHGYPHTIENGAGERLTFLRRVPGSDGERRRRARGRGSRRSSPGPVRPSSFKPGDAHKFWNAGQDDLRCSGYVEPPDNLEYFLTAIYESQRANGGSRPGPFDAAFLATRYRSEFGMSEIPAPVQRFVFPVLVTVGRLLGKYKKYADAPEPVRR